MVVHVALDEAEHQVPDIEGPTPHSTAMVPVQRLLALGQAEEGNITCFIQLVHGILEGCLGSLFVVCPDPQCSIIEVGLEDSLITIDHEEWHVTGGLTGVILRLQSTAGSSATHRLPNLFNWLKILGLRPCRTMPFTCSTCPFVRGCAMAAQSTWMWYSS